MTMTETRPTEAGAKSGTRVLVTGSRDWNDAEMIAAALQHATSYWPLHTWTLVHGACPTGADKLADEWAEAHGLTPERHPANWGLNGRKAGTVRNSVMVSLGADICLAFIRPCAKKGCQVPKPHGSHGATDCVNKAKAAGIMSWTHRDGW